MGQTSSVNTLAAATGMGSATSLIEWIANAKLGMAMPPEVVLTIAAVTVTIAHWLANVVNTMLGDGLAKGELAQFVPAPTTITRESGFARVSMLLGMALISLVCLGLAGCGSVNAWMSARQTMVEQDYQGVKKEVQKNNDDKLHFAVDLLCSTSIGALQRSAGEPNVVDAVLTACPLPNMTTLHGTGGNVTMYAPNAPTVSLTAQASTSTALAAIATPTDQTLQSIQQSLKAIQSAVTPTTKSQAKPTGKPSATPKAPSTVLPAPSISPSTTIGPVSTPATATVPTATETLSSAQKQMRTFLSAPRTPPATK